MNKERKTVIELQNVKRNFIVGEETVHALKGVSFKIYEGEFVTTNSDASTLPRAANTISTETPFAPCRSRNGLCSATER